MQASYRTSNMLNNDTLSLATTLHSFGLLEVMCRVAPMAYQAQHHKNIHKLDR